ESLAFVQMYGCEGLKNAFHMGRVNQMLAGFARRRTSSRQRVVEANLLVGRGKRATTAELLVALDSNMAAVREAAIAQLARTLPAPELPSDAHVALIGKTNFTKQQIVDGVAARGGTLTTKISDATTHVIVGAEPGGRQAAIGDRHIVL